MWQNLAPELVFGILRHFIPASGLKLSITEPVLFPWYLGQICSSWREVFISHPAFWNYLVIHLKSPLEEYPSVQHTTIDVDADRALAILNACLPRSGNRPFSFKLVMHLYKLCCGLKSRLGQQILELLLGQSTRWYDAHIELHDSLLPVLYMVKDRLPMLHSIRVNPWFDYYHDHGVIMCHPPPPYAALFENTPQLRCLHLCDFTWKIDWSPLTTIHLRYPSQVSLFEEFLDHLSRVSRLEELNIYGKILPDTPPVTLPFLKILRTGSERALQLFQMPMLQELCIRRITAEELDGTGFRDILSAYLPSLNHLTKLTVCTNRTSDVEIVLQFMPAVSDLSLYVCEPDYQKLLYQSRRPGRPNEYSLSVCKTDFLKLLTECPKARCLKTLTVGLFSCDENRLADITTCMKRTSLPEGVHRFDRLEHLSLVFGALADTHSFCVVKQHLEAEGIRNSIRKINDEDDNIVFDFFIDWDELCYDSE